MALGGQAAASSCSNVGADISYIPEVGGHRQSCRTSAPSGGIGFSAEAFSFCAARTFAGMGFSPALYVVMMIDLGMGWGWHQR